MNNNAYKIGTIIPVDFEIILKFFKDDLLENSIRPENMLNLKNGNQIILKNSNEENKFYVNFHIFFPIVTEENSKYNSVEFNFHKYLTFFKEINSEIRNLRSKHLIYPYEGALLSDIYSSHQFRKAMRIASNPKDKQIQGRKNNFC